MTVTAVATAAAGPEPLKCEPWCNRDRCVYADGESVIHKHVIGEVAGIEVVVERIDDYDADYRPRRGKVVINLYTLSGCGMRIEQIDVLSQLLEIARLFAAEVA